MARTTKDKPIAVIEDGAVYILQAGTKVFVKTADVCAATGVSNQWIGQMTSQGVINKTQTTHGAMYNLVESVKSFYEHSMSDSDALKAKKDEILLKKMKADVSIRQSKSVKEHLEANELLGKMHRSEDVAALTADLIYEFRSALIALPGRLAADLEGITDRAERAAIIQKAVYKLMADVSQYKYDSKKYEERVRARQGKDAYEVDADEDF